MSDKIQTKEYFVGNMEANTTLFTPPEIRPKQRPNESLEQYAKREWFIEFSYNGKRFKKPEGINIHTTYKAKYNAALAHLQKWEIMLGDGFNPEKGADNTQLIKNNVSLTITEAVAQYTEYLKASSASAGTLRSYPNKLSYLVKAMPDIKVNAIKDNDMDNFLNALHKEKGWVGKTFNNTKNIYSAFFTWITKQKYITENPMKGMSTKPVDESEKHKPLSNDHLKQVFDYLKVNDPVTHLFCNIIFYTCLRPIEVRRLQVKNVVLTSTPYIQVLASKAKNRKNDRLFIPEVLVDLFKNFGIENAAKDDYIFSANKKMFGTVGIGEHTIANNFKAALQDLEIDDINYTLYAIKHTSNIMYFNLGWTPAELMKRNRHSSIEQTLTYLRNLTDQIDLSDKEHPII